MPAAFESDLKEEWREKRERIFLSINGVEECSTRLTVEVVGECCRPMMLLHELNAEELDNT